MAFDPHNLPSQQHLTPTHLKKSPPYKNSTTGGGGGGASPAPANKQSKPKQRIGLKAAQAQRMGAAGGVGKAARRAAMQQVGGCLVSILCWCILCGGVVVV